MPTCMTVFVQTINHMYLVAIMVYLYKHFISVTKSALSMCWREACDDNEKKNEANGVWKEVAFVSIMLTHKNKILSGEHSVASVDIFALICTVASRSMMI